MPLTRRPKRVSPDHTYHLVLSIDTDQGILEGEERVRIHNPFLQSLDKVIFTLDLNLPDTSREIHVRAVRNESGTEAGFLHPTIEGKVDRSFLVVSLEDELRPKSYEELQIDFTSKFPRQVHGLSLPLEDSFYMSSSYYPRIIGYFDRELKSSRYREIFLASYKVQVTVAGDQVLASSGRVSREEVSGDKKTIYLESDATRGFGLVMSPEFKVRTETLQGVEVKSYCLPGGEERSARLLEAAADVLSFYMKDVGFYPERSLAILPGSEYSTGGYASSNMIFVHKPERKGLRNYLNCVVARELAHQYWGVYVGDPNDYPKWLTLGMSQWLDERYERSKDKSLHRKPWKYYLAGVALDVDTTIMQPLDKLDDVKFDWNSIIAHSKSYTVIKMLENIIGAIEFEKVAATLLERYGGKIVYPKDFIRVCHHVSGQKLDWFFDQWLHTNKKLDYSITNEVEAEVEKGVRMMRFRVKRFGDAKMPVKIRVIYKDRTWKTDSVKEDTIEAELVFTSKSTKEKIIIDPSDILPLKSKIHEVEPDILGYAFYQAGRYTEAAAKLQEALRANASNAEAQFILGLCLYSNREYSGAIEAFRKASDLSNVRTEKTRKAWSYIWIGHIHDLEGRRSEAIASYQKAAPLDSRESVRFDQYGINTDAASWVSMRLKTPYNRD